MNFREARTLIEKHEYHNPKSITLKRTNSYREFQIGIDSEGNHYAYDYLNKYKAKSLSAIKLIIDAHWFAYKTRITASTHDTLRWDGK